MPQNFLACDREQELLLPPSLREWLPEDHLAWFVIDAVAEMDLAAFYAAYRVDGHGRAAHEPAMMVALLRKAGSARRGIRNRAIIGVLYRTGVEIAEALELKFGTDVDLTSGQESIRVRGSRLAERTLALDSVALDLLRPWLKVRSELERSGEYLFCTIERGKRQGNKLHDAYVREYIRELAVAAKIPTRVHLNAFRHTLAAELLVEGWPLPYLQAQLGIQTLAALQSLFDHLNIRIPPSAEVMEIIRTRPPSFETYAP